MAEVVFDLCPYCGVRQVGATPEEDLYRCHGCNLFICRSWLIDDPADYVLNDDRPWLCPWCAYPVRLTHEVPETDEFPCPGCEGSLSADSLVTQRDVDGERKRSMKARHYLLLMAVAVIVVVITFSWMLRL